MSQSRAWLTGSQCCTQGLVSALTPVPFTSAGRGTSACSASRGHPEPAAEFLPQLQGEEIILAGLCSWPGWSPLPLPWARQRVMLLGGTVPLSPGHGEGMEKASPWRLPTSDGLQSLPGGLQPGSACPAGLQGAWLPWDTQRWQLCLAHPALSDTQSCRVSDPHRGGRMDKTQHHFIHH